MIEDGFTYTSSFFSTIISSVLMCAFLPDFSASCHSINRLLHHLASCHYISVIAIISKAYSLISVIAIRPSPPPPPKKKREYVTLGRVFFGRMEYDLICCVLNYGIFHQQIQKLEICFHGQVL